jgi:predicted dehydrogenase
VPLYDSYDAVLADPTVDAVDICVPNDLHRAFAERAFSAGKHVLCEKPIALTLTDADAMIAGAQQAGVVLQIAHEVRFFPEYRQTYDVYARGELGPAHWLAARRLTGVLQATQGTNGWRADPARVGGAVLDLQIHDLDFICWLLGPPDQVYAYGIKSAHGAWDHVLTTLRFPDGSGASVESSFILPGDPLDFGFRFLAGESSVVYRFSPRDFALHGLHGDASSEVAPSLVLYRADAAPKVLAMPDDDPVTQAIADEIAAFAQTIQTGQSAACSGAEARLALAVALASLQSCETGVVIHGPFS